MSTVHKIGRRKTSVARVYVKPGAGNITVNGKDAKLTSAQICWFTN